MQSAPLLESGRGLRSRTVSRKGRCRTGSAASSGRRPGRAAMRTPSAGHWLPRTVKPGSRRDRCMQGPECGRTVSITAPASPVRGRLRPCPCAPEPGAHGRVAEGGGPEPHRGTHTRRSAAYGSRGRTEVCKTVGSAYVGSNPTPATTCENGPLPGNSRLRGPFLLCPAMCHLVAL